MICIYRTLDTADGEAARLMADATHEINNRLAVIRATLELFHARPEALTPNRLEQALTAVEQISEIARRMHSVAQGDAAKIVVPSPAG